jgi:hypothetical protein
VNEGDFEDYDLDSTIKQEMDIKEEDLEDY